MTAESVPLSMCPQSEVSVNVWDTTTMLGTDYVSQGIERMKHFSLQVQLFKKELLLDCGKAQHLYNYSQTILFVLKAEES